MPTVHIRPLAKSAGIARFRAFAPDFATGTFQPAFDVLVNVEPLDLVERKGKPCGRVMIHPAEGADIDLSKAVTTTGLIPVDEEGHVSKAAIGRYLNPQRCLNYIMNMSVINTPDTDGDDDTDED